MYSTCLFCNASLGRNEVLEVFPVGKRLAFDAKRGRLWVVCRSCERWNLSPLEERWEVIEWCEERYSRSRLRASTENVGLAKLREGLELVRIGEPQRPEMAAWRYGDQFGRRRNRALATAGAGLGAMGAVLAGGAAAGMSVVVFSGGVVNLAQRIIHGDPKKVVARIPRGGSTVLEIRRGDLDRVRLAGGGGVGWQIVVPDGKGVVTLDGDDAYRASAAVLPAINRFGGSKLTVSRAVRELEEQGSAERFLSSAAHVPGVREPAPIMKRPAAIRLAIEMAVHEDTERRALEGELAMLEAAWRDAERIAEISDDLLTPRSLSERLARMRGRT
jgi:hypothetical protein